MPIGCQISRETQHSARRLTGRRHRQAWHRKHRPAKIEVALVEADAELVLAAKAEGRPCPAIMSGRKRGRIILALRRPTEPHRSYHGGRMCKMPPFKGRVLRQAASKPLKICSFLETAGNSWCGWSESNRHSLRKGCLRPSRLPFRHTRTGPGAVAPGPDCAFSSPAPIAGKQGSDRHCPEGVACRA